MGPPPLRLPVVLDELSPSISRTVETCTMKAPGTYADQWGGILSIPLLIYTRPRDADFTVANRKCPRGLEIIGVAQPTQFGKGPTTGSWTGNDPNLAYFICFIRHVAALPPVSSRSSFSGLCSLHIGASNIQTTEQIIPGLGSACGNALAALVSNSFIPLRNLCRFARRRN
jgi:hypothetical protein